MNENFNYIKKKTKFTQVSNICLYDDRLSLDSRGLMCILLSYPNSWKFYNKNVAKICQIGIDKLNKLYRQLEQFGYLKRTKKRDELGKFRGYEFEICDERTLNVEISLESTALKTPLWQKAITVKSSSTNTNITNTNNIVDVSDDYKEKMNELNEKLLQKQLKKDMKIHRLENLAISRQNRIDT